MIHAEEEEVVQKQAAQKDAGLGEKLPSACEGCAAGKGEPASRDVCLHSARPS